MFLSIAELGRELLPVVQGRTSAFYRRAFQSCHSACGQLRSIQPVCSAPNPAIQSSDDASRKRTYHIICRSPTLQWRRRTPTFIIGTHTITALPACYITAAAQSQQQPDSPWLDVRCGITPDEQLEPLGLKHPSLAPPPSRGLDNPLEDRMARGAPADRLRHK